MSATVVRLRSSPTGPRCWTESPPDLARHGLPGIQPGRYLLYVSRLEPENQADLVIRAYADVPGDVPLLIVGDAPYAAEYKAHLARLAAADPRVRMVGGKYGEAYTDLQRAAMAYIQATSVGGTHPALIESMAAGNLVLAFGTPENREVTAGTALIFDDQAQLTDALTRVVEAPDSPEHQALRSAARARAESAYSWPAIADQYEALLTALGDNEAGIDHRQGHVSLAGQGLVPSSHPLAGSIPGRDVVACPPRPQHPTGRSQHQRGAEIDQPRGARPGRARC